MRCISKLLTALAIGALAGITHAQSMQVPAPPQEQPIVIINATVHTVTGGTLEAPAYVVFREGKIASVGQGAPPTVRGARIINAVDKHVYPGLISSETQLGLTETGSVDVTQDYREFGDFTPEVRAAVAVNPDTDLIPVTRANGILTGVTFPAGGTVSGRCSIIRYDGWTWEQMAIDDAAGLVINWPRMEPISSRWIRISPEEQMERARRALTEIDDFFDDAQTYFEAKDANEIDETDLRFEAIRPFINGEKPIYVRASTAGQIETAVAWAIKRGMKPIILGGSEANEALPILKKHDVPVIISGTHRLPSRRHDPYDAPFVLPKQLHDAGVRFSIASGAETPHERNLNHIAATAAAYGLPKHVALEAVTINAARIIGIGETHGSLEPGKSATLIVTTGDPLEITTNTEMAFIDGREIDLNSRHKRLYRKYQEKYEQLGILQNSDTSGTRTTGLDENHD